MLLRINPLYLFMEKIMKANLLILFGFMLMAIINSTYAARTIYVPVDYPTIQDAINAAVQGDTICVAPGKYAYITMKKNIRIVGEDRDTTIIESLPVYSSSTLYSKAAVVFNDHDNTKLENLTITGGGLFDSTHGGAIVIMNSENVVIKNCLITRYKGSTEESGSSPNSGALALYTSTAEVKGCVFESNYAKYTGTVFCNPNSILRMDGCTLKANKSTYSGSYSTRAVGGIYAEGASLDIRECAFENNQTSCTSGTAAIYFISDKYLIISRCSFINNKSAVSSSSVAIKIGDASSSYMPQISISDNLFEDNDGDIQIRMALNPVQITRCAFIHQTPRSTASINLTYPNLVFSNCLVDGGGLGVDSSYVQNINVTNSTFVNCTRGFTISTPKTGYVFKNCIFRDNGIDLGTTQTLTVANSCIEDGYPGNISSDPLFIDAANHNYRLMYSSQCRNTGTNGATGIGTEDLEGKSRIQDSTVEMGCYEYPDELPSAAIAGIDAKYEFNQKTVLKAIFMLFSDNSAFANLSVEYSTDGGMTWHPATGDFSRSAPFASSPSGTGVDFYWDMVADLGRGNFASVIIRMTPYKENGTPGFSVTSDTFSINTFGEIVFNDSTFTFNTIGIQFIAPSASQMLSLRSNGAGSLGWSIANKPVWLDITPVSGSVDENGTDVVITPLTAGLSPGTYSADLILNSPDAFNTPQTITVKHNVGIERVAVSGGALGIQQTIDASNAGDLVRVMNGKYNEIITMKADVSLMGESMEHTIIIGNGEKTVVTATDCQSIVIGNLTLKRGSFGLQCTHSYIPIYNITTSENSEGGFAFYRYSECSLDNCIALNNGSTGFDCNSSSIISATNCLFANNGYAGVQAIDSASSLMNCTIANNAEYGILSRIANFTATNCVIYGNKDDLDGCSATYSLIGDGDAGTGNITGDPVFVSNDYMNYRIISGSPCINTGASNSAPSTDFEGDSRSDNPDMGFDEFADSDSDTMQDAWETAHSLNPDNSSDAFIDNDADELLNSAEYVKGSDPWDVLSPMGTVYVDASAAPGGNGTQSNPFQKIQDGLDAAWYGDAVIVAQGTYGEETVMKQMVTLEGAEPFLPIINAPSVWSEGIVSLGLTRGSVKSFKLTGFRDALVSIGSSVDISDCEAENTIISCLGGFYSSALGVRNMLFTGTKVSGIDLWMTSGISVSNCTIIGQNSSIKDFGIFCYRSAPAIQNSIIWNNYYELKNCTAIYSDIKLSSGGTGNINADPLFISGPLGLYYLSQISAGQFSNSPCVNVGSDTSTNLGMNGVTTRTDNAVDDGTVDMGYHYPMVLNIISIEYDETGATLYWNAKAGKSYIVRWSEDLASWNDVSVGAVSQWKDLWIGGSYIRFYQIVQQ
jgi:hypothetical protein